MVYAAAGQLSCVVPYGLARKPTTQVQVEYKKLKGNIVTVPVVDAVPGIFSQNLTGTGQGAILNQDYSVNSASNPLGAGGIAMVYATGEGQTTPGGVDGKPATGPTYPAPVLQPVTATVGGKAAAVKYAGAAPDFVAGVLQVNVEIPPGLAPGNAELIIQAGANKSQTGLAIAVK